MKEIKDILKLPFRSNGYLITDNDGHFVCQMFSTDKLDLRSLLVEALNEKAKRHGWGEKKQWIRVETSTGVLICCPYCEHDIWESAFNVNDNRFCSFCGVRLDPPEEEGNYPDIADKEEKPE